MRLVEFWHPEYISQISLCSPWKWIFDTLKPSNYFLSRPTNPVNMRYCFNVLYTLKRRHMFTGIIQWFLSKCQQSRIKFMKQCQEIRQNWTGQENWNLFLRNFWALVPNFYSRKEDWVLGSVSYHFCDIPNIS